MLGRAFGSLRFIVLLTHGGFTLAGCGDDAPSKTFDAGVDDSSIEVSQRFVTNENEACLDASPIMVESQGQPFVLSIDQRGIIRAYDPETGVLGWSGELPAVPGGGGERAVYTTPVLVDRYLVIGYQSLRTSHFVGLFDVETRAMAAEFEVLRLAAEVPSFDGADKVRFRGEKQLMRGTVKHVPADNLELGRAYLALGNAPNSSPHHGWVFELNLDQWRTGGADKAIENVLVTTADNDCGPAGSPDPGLCGGGIWNAAGVQIYEDAQGQSVLYFATGNGRLNPGRKSFANALMRVPVGLGFESGCDAALCADFDEVQPSTACLESCKDVFVPRLEQGEAPLAPEDGRCDGLSFTECYRKLDMDLGSSGPVRVTLPSGKAAFVQAGKDGALYLIDGERLGQMHQRLQVMSFCGTQDDRCRAFWLGLFVTHPVVAYVDGAPVVILASNMADRSHASGISAIDITETDEGPRMSIRWQVPDFGEEYAKTVFRSHPGRPVLYTHKDDTYVFVVETRRGDADAVDAPPGALWGVNVEDGSLVAHLPITDAGSRWNLPLIAEDTLYLASCDRRAADRGYLEAFDIKEVTK